MRELLTGPNGAEWILGSVSLGLMLVAWAADTWAHRGDRVRPGWLILADGCTGLAGACVFALLAILFMEVD